MKTLCIIPARGGSKGLPRKNLRQLGGVSLLERAIRTARAADLVDLVAVSTEDAEIAAVAHWVGAEVIDRPPELATDEAGTAETLLHGLRWMRMERERSAVLLVCVQCTCPFTAAKDIDNTVRYVRDHSQITVAMTVQRGHVLLWDFRGLAVNHNARHRQRRQEITDQFVETGAVYVTRVDAFESSGQLHHEPVGLVLQPEERVLDIDTELDLQRAEAWLQATSGQPGQ